MPETVIVPYGDSARDTATLLLAAVDELDLDSGVVRTTEGAFIAPKEVADKAGVDYEGKADTESEPEPEPESEPEPPKKKPAKKAARKSRS